MILLSTLHYLKNRHLVMKNVFRFLVLTASLVFYTNNFARSSTELRQEIKEPDFPLSLSGSYLSALSANRAKDIPAASLFYDKALAADPANETLLERVFFLRLADGDIEGAIDVSDRVLKQNQQNWFAHLALGVTALKAKAYNRAINAFEQMSDGPLAELTGNLLHAWALAASDEHDAALDLLKDLDSGDSLKPYQWFHAALIAEDAGKIKQATDLHNKAHSADQNVVRKIEALTRFQLRNGLEDQGRENLDQLMQQFPNRTSVKALAAELEGEKKVAPYIGSPLVGAMEVLYGLGSILGSDENAEIAYIFINLASYLVPNNPLPHLLLGELLENDGGFERAIERYKKIKKTSPYHKGAQLRIAFAYNALEDLNSARQIMDDIIERHPNDVISLTSLGNILRSNELFEEARTAYNNAILSIDGAQKPINWSLYYSRGITNERTKRWEEAEADFRKSLALSPDEPQVLNYLGYSLIDLGMKYEEALEMIERAVELRPDDPFIIDSLGWAHYKLENYEEAVKHLERAVQIRPQDPILNDHLGDAYWHVGRKLEAQFQWRHARDLDPEEKYRATILKKIETGRYVDGNS